MKESPTVLVLGAYGEAGAAVVRGLCATKRFEVLAAGRSADRLAALERSVDGLTTRVLDITDAQALNEALGCAGLVINCVGPYIGTGARTARSALDVGIPYLDVASEQEHYRRLQALDGRCRAEGGLILTGVGAYPGLSGLLLRALTHRHPDAFGAEMALVTGPHADPASGAAQSLTGVIELGYEHVALAGGELQSITTGRHRGFDFPDPFGARSVLTWPQMEILAMAKAGELRDLSTYAALAGEPLPAWWVFKLLRRMQPRPGSRSLGIVKRGLTMLQSRRAVGPVDATTNRGAMIIHLETPKQIVSATALVNDLEAVTAWLPVYATTQWANGALAHHGVVLPMDVFDPDPVLAQLARSTSGLVELTGF